MKKQLTILSFIVALSLNHKAQTVLTEDFNSPFSFTNPTGWLIQNNSAPTGTLSWFQGNSNVFSAYNGSANDYVGVNYNSTAATGEISNWLISPTVNLVNGATIQFATRTVSATTVFPDRLEVRYSTIGATTIGLGAATVSSYSNLVFSVNPNLSVSSATSVPGATSVGSYPQVWKVYTAVISNTALATPVNGRIAFRYWVTSGGPGGANSSYIGIDEFKYSVPCAAPSMSITSTSSAAICGGSTVGLSVNTGTAVGASSYLWNNGNTSTLNVVSPTTTTTYTVYGTSTTGCVGQATLSVPILTVPNLVVPSYTICPGTSITINATGASSYALNGGASSTLASFVFTPTAPVVFTVTGIGSNTQCPVSQTAAVGINSLLSVAVSSSTNSICIGGSVTLSAQSAASIYSWSTGGANATVAVSPTASTIYSVGAALSLTCFGTNTIAINVNALPTLTVATSSNTYCSGNPFTVTTSGANSYNYVISSNFISSANPIIINAPTTSSASSFTVFGTSAGCTSSVVNSYTIAPSPVVLVSPASPFVCTGQNVTISASGASSYAWSGASVGTNSSIVYSAGTVAATVAYTLVGTSSNGCTNTQNVNVTVSTCSGLDKKELSALSIYPNPFKNILNISGITGKIEMYNLIGELVLSENISNKEILGTESLNRGIYFVKVYDTNEKNVSTLKLIKE